MADARQVSTWKVSSRCEAADCVEVLIGADLVFIRDSAHREGPILTVEPGDWMAFVAHLRDAHADGSRSSSGADRWSTS
jgi:hypothetical protein